MAESCAVSVNGEAAATGTPGTILKLTRLWKDGDEVTFTLPMAFYSKKVSLPLEQTLGRICAEFVMCYPPGIPVLAPGEKVTDEILQYIGYAKEKGCSMTGPTDPHINNLNVVI